MPENLLLTNGRFYTQNKNQPTASAVAIINGHIAAVGSNEEINNFHSPKTKSIDLQQAFVLPGLVDAHVHFQGFTRTLKWLDLFVVDTLADALPKIAAFATANPNDEWLQGIGWASSWSDCDFPTATDLDKIIPNRLIILRDKSTHAAWVNSHTLKAAGINRDTPNPPGGQIQKDQNGNPTGILFENGINLVKELIPTPTAQQLAEQMRIAQQKCWAVGLTGIHDFDGKGCFESLQILREMEELGLRILKNIPVSRLNHALEIGLRTGFGDPWIRIGGIKQFADGALGPRTALMLNPYEGELLNRGIAVTDKEEMTALIDLASAHGLSSTIHAIGDQANHDVLDAYASVRQQEKIRQQPHLRHRIEHVQIIHPEDMPRLAELQLIASMQPIHATADMQMADRHWGKRAAHSYALQSIWQTGATVALSSDAPIESIDPLKGIHAAVTRQRADGTPNPEGWYPAQKLSLAQAIYGFTMGAAIASNQETLFGSIEVGKLADFTLLDQDLFAIDPADILHTNVIGTMINGRFRYGQFS